MCWRIALAVITTLYGCNINNENTSKSEIDSIRNGKPIQPTGKSFNIPMCTIGVWGMMKNMFFGTF